MEDNPIAENLIQDNSNETLDVNMEDSEEIFDPPATKKPKKI